MIHTHEQARDWAKTVLASCDTSYIVRPELSSYKELDDRRGRLFFKTDQSRAEIDSEDGARFSKGAENTAVDYRLPIEPAKLRRDIIIHYDMRAFREIG